MVLGKLGSHIKKWILANTIHDIQQSIPGGLHLSVKCKIKLWEYDIEEHPCGIVSDKDSLRGYRKHWL